MKVAFCTAEAAPFAKVGGLGDVAGSLPKALERLGEEVIVCLPRYGGITSENFDLFDTGIQVSVTHEGRTFPVLVWESQLPQSEVRVYLFDNPELYGYTEAVYPQTEPRFEALRFEVLSLAVLQFLQQMSWQPDMLHLQDWHTSPVAYYLNTHYRSESFFQNVGTVLTLHNMAYQGCYEGKNWLQEGIINSDALVAVSPTYAREILTPQGGAGLEGLLQTRQASLQGILNGIDYSVFNPATDVFLPMRYDGETLERGKTLCKEALQMELGLEIDPAIPIFGMVTRLVEQKGLDILLPILPQMAQLSAQFVFLGTGEPRYEEALRYLNRESPNIRTIAQFNLALGQQIYGGADVFLMPSRFEPCGLGQLIALRYGTAPLVRKTGGLADTVFDVSQDPRIGNGFLFEDYQPEALLSTIQRAIALWESSPEVWSELRKRGMQADHSWGKSAAAYQNVYQNVYQQRLQRM